MRIAQVLLPGASEYERKSQRIDRAALLDRHEVVVVPPEEVRGSGAQVAHVYASGELPRAPFIGFPIPYIAPYAPKKTRWSFRKPADPDYLSLPPDVPEAVDDAYFDVRHEPRNERKVIGSFGRRESRGLVELTQVRLQRTRGDVVWRVFERVPEPRDLAGVDLWVDPAAGENDLDGFVAEALVVGVPTVAVRTAVNVARLGKGSAGFLVPPNDPNEMTHAILSALFKPEVAQHKVTAARQTAGKFRPRQRLRVLLHLYESLIR